MSKAQAHARLKEFFNQFSDALWYLSLPTSSDPGMAAEDVSEAGKCFKRAERFLSEIG